MNDYIINSILTTNDIKEAYDLLLPTTKYEKEELLTQTLYDIGFIEPQVSDWVNHLKHKNYFTAPASKGHHGAFEGALFIHSFLVGLTLAKLTRLSWIKWNKSRSPMIVGLLHDLCKMDAYEPIYDETEVFNSAGVEFVHNSGGITGYEYNPKQFPLGHHGLASLVHAQSFIRLTEEEILCIRWHMGAYEGKETWDNYDRAIKMYENVLWTHHADMYVSKVLGV